LEFESLHRGAVSGAVALALPRADIPSSDAGRVVEPLSRTRLEMPPGRVLLNGEDVTEAIRYPNMSDASSRVAVEPHVRAVLVGWQRQIAVGRDMVCEGRDQGSVGFTDSPCKLYLPASLHTRAARRLAELRIKGIDTSFDQVVADLE